MVRAEARGYRHGYKSRNLHLIGTDVIKGNQGTDIFPSTPPSFLLVLSPHLCGRKADWHGDPNH